MNQDQVKEILLQIEESGLEFSVTFTGKASKKVNGLYKSDTHEILLHNKNFSVDNELLYTAIHEYTHHRLCELDGTRSGRVHTQRFWSYFHRLLQKAEEKGLYKIAMEESPELLELTDTIRTTIMAEDGKLMKELGRLLSKARVLCKQAGVRYEDYIDRVLCLPRASAATIEKIHAFDVKPELGYEAMKVVANIANPDKRAAAEDLFLQKHSPAFVRDSVKSKPQDEDPRRKLENEKRRIERTIVSLQARLSELEDTLAKLPVTPFIFCFFFLLRLLSPLAADNTGVGQMQIPAIPDIPEVTIGGGITRPPAPPVIQPPAFLQQKHTPSSAAGTKGKQTGNAAAASGNSGKSDVKKSTALNGLNAKTLAALSQNSGNLTLLNNLLGTDAGLGGNAGLGNVTGLQTDTGGAVLTKILTELEKLQAQTAQAAQKETTQTGQAVQKATTAAENSAARASGMVGGQTAEGIAAPKAVATDNAAGTAGNTGAGNAADAHIALAQGAAAELIRLRINGKEIKDDLIYTFCSAPAANGSFLYGADRRFTANGAELNETAYFLCRKTEAQQYEITMDLRQEPLNANSFLYKLYQLSPVSVEQTSDIIFWHYKASDLEVELIFRIVHL
ncbi:hypothetical protein [Treponema sp. OMZ 906]|uniref:hypothetical protein n=1 Tax=Treponema sp. OMZ 906 TaxID=2563662 RepID=UPI0020A5FC94|nr:hypothetical protein [Treponema sp. OMZ 906]UTC55091.1 hypothetical protein E4N69_10080 [Treponema sp. OMZ 906]